MPNKKRNNRKKSTKQPSATTTAPTQVSELPVNVISVAATGGLEGAPTTTDSAPLPDFIQASIDNAVGSRAVDIDSIISQNTKQHSSTPVGNSTANATSLNKTLNDASATTDSAPLPDFIQTSIDNAVGSRVVDIDSIISSVGQKVSNGDYKEKPKETSSTTPKATSAVSASSGTTSTSKLSDAVEYAIQSVVQSPVVDAYKISHGSTGSQNVPESAVKDLKTAEKSVASGSKDSNAAATEQNESTPKESAAKDLKNIEKSIDSDAKATESNVSGQPKEAAAKDLKTIEKSIESESKENKSTDQKKKDNVGERKTSSEHKQTSSTDPNESKPPAAPPKTGDNVQKKNKSSEHKKSNFLKKKDCIIL